MLTLLAPSVDLANDAAGITGIYVPVTYVRAFQSLAVRHSIERSHQRSTSTASNGGAARLGTLSDISLFQISLAWVEDGYKTTYNREGKASLARGAYGNRGF